MVVALVATDLADHGVGDDQALETGRSHQRESVFAIARTAGWLAHAIEEFREPPLRFRAEARHVSN